MTAPPVWLPLIFALQDTAAGESVSTAVGTYSHAFAAAVLALLPGCETKQQQQQQQQAGAAAAAEQNGSHVGGQQAAALADGGLAELLLMSHHPAITAGVGKRLAPWQCAGRRVKVLPTQLKGRDSRSSARQVQLKQQQQQVKMTCRWMRTRGQQQGQLNLL